MGEKNTPADVDEEGGETSTFAEDIEKARALQEKEVAQKDVEEVRGAPPQTHC